MIGLPSWIPYHIRAVLMTAYRLIVFVSCAIQVGVPIRDWPMRWKQVEQERLARIRKAVFEARMDGKVRQDDGGRLWWIGDE